MPSFRPETDDDVVLDVLVDGAWTIFMLGAGQENGSGNGP